MCVYALCNGLRPVAGCRDCGVCAQEVAHDPPLALADVAKERIACDGRHSATTAQIAGSGEY